VSFFLIFVAIFFYGCWAVRFFSLVFFHTTTISFFLFSKKVFYYTEKIKNTKKYVGVEKLVQSILAHEQTCTFPPPMEEEDAIQSTQFAPRQEPPKSPQAHILKSALFRHFTSLVH